MANEPTLSRGRLPPGYVFVAKGNVYVTGNCRKQTQATGQTVYLVVDGKDTCKQTGIAVPSAIHKTVQQTEVATRAARAVKVDRRDNAIKKAFAQVILQEFPRLPRQDLAQILSKALEKGAGKVGRTGRLGDRKKAQLAVRAHIRHGHTDYDKILRGSRRDSSRRKARNTARKMVQSQVDVLAAAWGPAGRHPPPARPRQAATGPLVSMREAKEPLAVGRQRASKARSAAVLATAITAVPPSTLLEAAMAPRPLQAAPHQQHRAEVVHLTVDDDDAPEPARKLRQPPSRRSAQPNRITPTQTRAKKEPTHPTSTRLQKRTALRLMRAMDRDRQTLDRLPTATDSASLTASVGRPSRLQVLAAEDGAAFKGTDRAWVRAQSRAMMANRVMHGVDGLQPRSPGEGPAKVAPSVERLGMAVTKGPSLDPSGQSGSRETPRRRAATVANRRLSQYVDDALSFAGELE